MFFLYLFLFYSCIIAVFSPIKISNDFPFFLSLKGGGITVIYFFAPTAPDYSISCHTISCISLKFSGLKVQASSKGSVGDPFSARSSVCRHFTLLTWGRQTELLTLMERSFRYLCGARNTMN